MRCCLSDSVAGVQECTTLKRNRHQDNCHRHTLVISQSGQYRAFLLFFTAGNPERAGFRLEVSSVLQCTCMSLRFGLWDQVEYDLLDGLVTRLWSSRFRTRIADSGERFCVNREILEIFFIRRIFFTSCEDMGSSHVIRILWYSLVRIRKWEEPTAIESLYNFKLLTCLKWWPQSGSRL